MKPIILLWGMSFWLCSIFDKQKNISCLPFIHINQELNEEELFSIVLSFILFVENIISILLTVMPIVGIVSALIIIWMSRKRWWPKPMIFFQLVESTSKIICISTVRHCQPLWGTVRHVFLLTFTFTLKTTIFGAKH